MDSSAVVIKVLGLFLASAIFYHELSAPEDAKVTFTVTFADGTQIIIQDTLPLFHGYLAASLINETFDVEIFDGPAGNREMKNRLLTSSCDFQIRSRGEYYPDLLRINTVEEYQRVIQKLAPGSNLCDFILIEDVHQAIFFQGEPKFRQGILEGLGRNTLENPLISC